jgi:uncharacterized protein (TIRG00374 family)
MNFKKPVQIIVTLSLLALLFAKIGFGAIASVLDGMSLQFICLACIFLVFQYVFLSLRWQFIVNSSTRHINFNYALKTTAASNLANALLFTSLSGVIVRIAMTMQKGFSAVKASYLSVTDRILTLFALLALGALFMPYALNYLPEVFLNIFISLAFAFLLSFIFAIWWLGEFSLKTDLRKHRYLLSALSYLRRILWRKKVCAQNIFLFSFLGQICFFISVYFLILANGGKIDLLPLLSVIPIISIISAFPISIGGWGVREGAFVYGLQLLSLPAEIALVTSIQVGILTAILAFVMYVMSFGKDVRGFEALKNSRVFSKAS